MDDRNGRDMDSESRAGILYRAGFEFGFDPAACAACPGLCCSGEPGKIWVNEKEIAEISHFLGIPPVDLIHTCLYRVEGRLSIRERRAEDGFRCIFLESGRETRCAVYPVRPRQCRTYPFWDRYKGRGRLLVGECPGIRMPE